MISRVHAVKSISFVKLICVCLIFHSHFSPCSAEESSDFLGMIKKNCTPKGLEQSPELYVVYHNDVLTASNPDAGFACSHGSPWEDDTRIPLILYGRGIKTCFVAEEPASLEDITPTLSSILGIHPPQESNGRVLKEAFNSKGLFNHIVFTRPKAVCVLTLDQCRADYFSNPQINPALKFTRYIASGRATTYANARLSYAGSRTAVSHAVLGTGATPGVNGIVGNNIKKGNAFPLAFDDQPRHSMAMTNLLTPTLSDVMDPMFDNLSKIISISPYARAALAMGGHGASFSGQSDKDIVLELSSDTGLAYTNGAYYSLPDYLVWSNQNPVRIDQWLSTHYGIILGHTPWTEKTVIVDKGPYAVRPYNTITGPQGEFPDGESFTFAHSSAKAGGTAPESSYQLWNESAAYPSNDFFKETMLTPFYQLWAADMLLMTIDKEGVGLDRIPDLVYFNFKCLDLVGHTYGVNSPELYSYLYAVDYCIRKIVFFLDERIGPNQYTLVITADHGAHNAYDDKVLYTMDLFNAIEGRFGENIILNDPSTGAPFDDMIYLDTRLLSQGGHKQADVARFIEETFPGHVYKVFTKDEIFAK